MHKIGQIKLECINSLNKASVLHFSIFLSHILLSWETNTNMNLLPAHHGDNYAKTLQEGMTQAGIIHESVPVILIKNSLFSP